MSKKQKLELTWIGKVNRPRLEPRILLEDPEKSCHAKYRVTHHGQLDKSPEQRSNQNGGLTRCISLSKRDLPVLGRF